MGASEWDLRKSERVISFSIKSPPYLVGVMADQEQLEGAEHNTKCSTAKHLSKKGTIPAGAPA